MRKVTSKDKRKPIYSGRLGKLAQLWDGAVGLVAPGVAHQMRTSRMKSAALIAYEAAKITNTNPSTESTNSADAEILPNLERLRYLSRKLTRDDAHAGAVLEIHEDLVVGDGLRVQAACTPQETGLSAEACEEYNRSCQSLFERWCEEDADATGVGTFYDLQALALRTSLQDGDAIGHALFEGKKMSVELIDADRLMSPGDRDTPTIRGGVEIDERGRRTAYHILSAHPDDESLGAVVGEPVKHQANDGSYQIIQHVFKRVRAGQTRGIPLLTAALLYFDNLHHYMTSELIAARASSNFAMFIKRGVQPGDQDIFPVHDSEQATSADYHEVIEPGTIEYLNEGEEPVAWNPNRPGTAFEPFTLRVLRAAASACGLSYEVVARDFGRMNLSSARAMMREIHRGMAKLSARFARQFCRPHYRNRIQLAIANGELEVPAGYLDNPEPFLRHRWVSPSMGMIDPKTDAETSVLLTDNNLSTPQEEARARGRDYGDLLRHKAEAIRMRRQIEKEYGLERGELDPVQKPGTPGAAPASSSSGDTDPNQDPQQDPAEDPNQDPNQ